MVSDVLNEDLGLLARDSTHSTSRDLQTRKQRGDSARAYLLVISVSALDASGRKVGRS